MNHSHASSTLHPPPPPGSRALSPPPAHAQCGTLIDIGKAHFQCVEGNFHESVIDPVRQDPGRVTRQPANDGIQVFIVEDSDRLVFHAQRFLCAMNGGTIGFDRDHANDWEQFKIVPGPVMYGGKRTFTIECCRDNKKIYVDREAKLMHDDGRHSGQVFVLV
jgi:hypothetical protein